MTSELALSRPVREIVLAIGENHEDEITLTETGVVIPENISQETWINGLVKLNDVHRKSRVWMADYIKYGRKNYGDEAVDKHLEQLELPFSLVEGSRSIANVSEENRLPNLSADHYAVLGSPKLKLNSGQQMHWARIANDQSLSPARLKKSIQKGSVVEAEKSKEQNRGVITINGIRAEFDIWLKRVGGVDGIRAMEPLAQIDILKEIESIHDLYHQIRNENINITPGGKGKPAPAKKSGAKQKPAQKPKTKAKAKAKK